MRNFFGQGVSLTAIGYLNLVVVYNSFLSLLAQGDKRSLSSALIAEIVFLPVKLLSDISDSLFCYCCINIALTYGDFFSYCLLNICCSKFERFFCFFDFFAGLLFNMNERASRCRLDLILVSGRSMAITELQVGDCGNYGNVASFSCSLNSAVLNID